MAGTHGNCASIEAQAIEACLSRSAIFLVVTVTDNPTALATVCSALDGLDDLVKTVGFRDQSDALSCIAGISNELWDRLQAGKRPKS